MKWQPLLVLLVVIPAVLAYTTDDIFKELKTNDAITKESVFTLTNPTTELAKAALSCRFIEACGSVNDYELLAWQLCPKYNKTPVYSMVDICTADNKTKELTCHKEEQLTSFERVLYYEYDYCPVTSVAGTKDYKLRADINYAECSDGWGYAIDWVCGLEVGGTLYEAAKWDWYNTTWLSKYPITYTCNNPAGDCTNEWIALNYSAATNCDTDLRVIKDDSTAVPFVINDTAKMVYTYFSGITGVANTSYSLYCNNDAAGDGSTATVKLGYTNCDNSDGWTVYNNGAISINTTGDEVNRSGYGSFAKIEDDDAAGLDGEYFSFTSTNSGIVYLTYFMYLPSVGAANQNNFQVTDDTTHIYGGVGMWTNAANWVAYGSGYVTLKASIPLGKWHITKLTMDLDANTYDIEYNGEIVKADMAMRQDGWGGSMAILLLMEDGTAYDQYVDNVIISRNNITQYTTAGTVVIGAEETQAAGNQAPTVNETTVTTPAYTNTNLNCSARPLDADNATVTLEFTWLENGAVCAGCGYDVNITADNNTVTYTTILVTEQKTWGDNWTCRARAYDGTTWSGYVNSTVQISNSVPTWTQTPPNWSNYYTVNVSINLNATDADAGDTLVYAINDSRFDINSANGIINRTTSQTDVGNYSIAVNVTDGTAWLNATFRILILNTTCNTSYYCLSYTCNATNINLCTSVNDSNGCGVEYSGDYTEFYGTCEYCALAANEDLPACYSYKNYKEVKMLPEKIFFILALVGAIAITLIKLYNVMHKGSKYGFDWTIILFIITSLCYGVGLFIYLNLYDELVILTLFRLLTGIFVLNFLFLIIEVLQLLVSSTRGAVRGRHTPTMNTRGGF